MVIGRDPKRLPSRRWVNRTPHEFAVVFEDEDDDEYENDLWNDAPS